MSFSDENFKFTTTLHIFSDVCKLAYATYAFLRIENENSGHSAFLV